MEQKEISKAVISRLPRYYRYLGELLEEGVERISSNDLSIRMKVTASQIRQDLNNFGGFGQQGYGYNVKYLYSEIARILGIDRQHNLIIIGAGNLGQAIANYTNFERRGFLIKGMFDVNPRLVGLVVRGVEIRGIEDLEQFIKDNEVQIAALTIPKSKAPEIADRLVKAGIKAIWNFAHTDLQVPDDVVVENVHLSESLMRLSYLFDIDSDKKQKVLNDIISNRGASLESGSIELIVPNDNLFCGIMSYSQLVSEVCNMEILSREMVSSLFYDHLSESVELIREKSDLTYIKDYQVPGHPDMNVDFAFLGTGKVRPIYLFGVKDTNKAQQTTINCLNLTLDKIPHRSVSVFENIDGVTTFSRNALINASGKVYSDLASFQKNGAVYIKTELAG